MSWMCSGASNKELVANLWKHGIIKTPRIREAFEKVDRAHFSPIFPYEDSPQRIGYDATISAPHMHAHAAEALASRLQPGAKVLDVGSGSGYLTAVFAHLISPGGQCIGVEHIPQLVAMSNANLEKDPTHQKMLDDGTIKIFTTDGRQGSAEHGPYDAIHVGAAAKGFPQPLIDQLKAPGSMFIPVEEGYGAQHIYHVEKKADGTVEKIKSHGVLYVPLTDAKVHP